MAETANNQSEKQFAIQKIYVKDISFEAPNTPMIFTTEWKPEVTTDLNTTGSGIDENTYEIVLSVTATVKVNEETAYLVEVHQAGIFLIAGFDEETLKEMHGSFCPSILFPFVREAMSDIVVRGGFPPLLLNPVNFDAIYQRTESSE